MVDVGKNGHLVAYYNVWNGTGWTIHTVFFQATPADGTHRITVQGYTIGWTWTNYGIPDNCSAL